MCVCGGGSIVDNQIAKKAICLNRTRSLRCRSCKTSLVFKWGIHHTFQYYESYPGGRNFPCPSLHSFYLANKMYNISRKKIPVPSVGYFHMSCITNKIHLILSYVYFEQINFISNFLHIDCCILQPWHLSRVDD